MKKRKVNKFQSFDAPLSIQEGLTILENDNIEEAIAANIWEDLFELPVVNKQKKVIGFLTSEMISRNWSNKIENENYK